MRATRYVSCAFALAAALACAAGASAASNGATVGAAAALGLTGASGKTQLGDKAGAIEAALLFGKDLAEAGATIVGRVREKTTEDRTVLILTSTQTVPLSQSRLTANRIDWFAKTLAKVCACSTDSQGARTMGAWSSALSIQPSDIAAVLATDKTIAAVDIARDDRELIDAIVMQPNSPPRGRAAAWTPTSASPAPTLPGSASTAPQPLAKVTFVIPGEVANSQDDNAVTKNYKSFGDALAKCEALPTPSEGQKSLKVLAEAFATDVNSAADPLSPSKLAQAIVYNSLAEKNPWILRVAIENAGGTTVTRGSVWYTLLPLDAVSLTAGLMVSYRLVDPATGETKMAGFVRCAAGPKTLGSIESSLGAASKAKCDFIG